MSVHGMTQPRSYSRGFTLLEAMIATMIVGSGIVAIMGAQRAFHTQNDWAAQAAIGQQLGVELRELVLGLPQRDPVTNDDVWGPEPDEVAVDDFDDLDDFDGAVFDSASGTGPLNALRVPIQDMAGWRQRVFVENINPFDLTETVADGGSDLMRVTVIVERRLNDDTEPQEFTRVTWIAPR
jgi:type II secretory pathway pseudopilin PulG